MQKFSVLFLLIMRFVCLATYAQSTERCLTQNDAQDRYARYSPDGQQIIFESDRDGNWEIYLMKVDGTEQQRLTSHDSADRRPTWHPSGKMILFESTREGKNGLFIYSLIKEWVKPIPLPEIEGEVIFAHFAPSGKQIAFSVQEGERVFNLYTIRKNGKKLRALTIGQQRSLFPAWSPSCAEIAFFSRRDTDNKDDEIYSLNLETLETTRLTFWPKHNFCPAWSPDGSQIAYAQSMEGSRPEIYVMDKNGENARRITYNEDGDTLPAWSPDGTRLLITAYRNGNYEICEVELGNKMKGN